jgi:ribosomal protein S18 acetylase RimI-like enzyme
MPPRRAPPFSLPTALLSAGYALRPETDADLPFLMRLYASTREDELSLIGWSAAQKEAFLAGQFAAHRHHYRTALAGCRFDILERDGAAVGRLYLQTRQTQLHLVDITLLPACRGHGLGATILRALQAAAAADGRGVGLTVATFSPALRLYRRLGFTDVADHGLYCEMEWRPAPAQLNTA